MKKINRTYLMGALALIFAVWVFWQTGKIPTKLVSNEPGPKLFPYISAIGTALFAVLSLIFDAPKENAADAKPYMDKAGWIRMAIIAAECVLFVLGMEYIGFWITGMIGMFVFIWTLKGEKKVNLLFTILLSVGLASLCYFGFTKGFSIPLPKGTLWKKLGIKML